MPLVNRFKYGNPMSKIIFEKSGKSVFTSRNGKKK
jgi:hypothetical protein